MPSYYFDEKLGVRETGFKIKFKAQKNCENIEYVNSPNGHDL